MRKDSTWQYALQHWFIASGMHMAYCFPAHATVEVFGRGAVMMEKLQYGDKVKMLTKSIIVESNTIHGTNLCRAAALSLFLNPCLASLHAILNWLRSLGGRRIVSDSWYWIQSINLGVTATCVRQIVAEIIAALSSVTTKIGHDILPGP